MSEDGGRGVERPPCERFLARPERGDPPRTKRPGAPTPITSMTPTGCGVLRTHGVQQDGRRPAVVEEGWGGVRGPFTREHVVPSACSFRPARASTSGS